MSFRRDPDRLDSLSANDSDVELARALEALAQDRPTEAELQRVRRRLEATLSQQTTSHTHTAMLQAVAGLVVLVAALLSVLPSLSHVSLSDSSHAEKSVVADSATLPPSAAPSQPATSDAAQSVEPAVPPSAAPTLNPKHVQPMRVERREPKASEQRSQASALVQPMRAKASESSVAQRTNETSEQHTRLVTPRHEQSTEAARPARVELDEVTLIQQARQLTHDDPEAALRSLDQHKRKFPHGMLSQEREVLTIELLRALSRQAEADKQLETFRRDYPRSMYLPRLGAPGHRD